jgi:uncharacterized protein YkwD
MPEFAFNPARRMLILGGIASLGALASCRSVLPTAEGGGASRAAAGRLGAIRGSNGLASVAPDATAEAAALEQARFMVVGGRMDHTALTGRDFVSRMKRNRVPSPAAENLAHGRMNLDRLFAMWMDSEGHRRNMLDPRFARFGLAYAEEAGDSRYWALVLSA